MRSSFASAVSFFGRQKVTENHAMYAFNIQLNAIDNWVQDAQGQNKLPAFDTYLMFRESLACGEFGPEEVLDLSAIATWWGIAL